MEIVFEVANGTEVVAFKRFRQAPDTGLSTVEFEFNNDDLVPGNAGADEGFLVGAAVITLTDNSGVLPPNRETPVLEFHFVVREDAPIGSTELRFLDGGQVSGGSVQNKLIAEGSDITPELANSFVFVNGLIQILGDVTAFIRGDSNGDGKVDISDPITTLSFLFLGARQPACFDAADANDDGEVDVSDGIATFNYLYVGDRVLPPPNGVPGTDPTPDSLGCLFRGQ